MISSHGEVSFIWTSFSIVLLRAAMESEHITLPYDRKRNDVRHVQATGDEAEKVAKLDQ